MSSSPGSEPPAGGYRNIHGRKAGRGARPYLILLKLLFVAGFVGGLVSALAVVFFVPEPATPEGWRWQTDLIYRLYVGVIVPSLVGAMLVGVCLAAALWRVMIRMRWFVAKMILIAVCVPPLHLFMRGRWLTLHEAVSRETPDLIAAGAIRGQMLAGTLATLAVGIAAVVLGRIKPRLGQDYGRTFARDREPTGRGRGREQTR